MPEAPERPVLTFPPKVAAAVRAAYDGAGVILEYGSGGSTVLAAEMAGKTVFTVESDRRWIRRLEAWFAQNPGQSAVRMHWANIGPTKDWGHPKDASLWRRFAGYPLSVWDRPDFLHPDVVLIDGRFRVGCLLATALRILRPVTVLFDDYVPRKAYHAAEEFLTPAALIDRMARFEVTPMVPDMARLRRIIGLMQAPV